MTIVDLLKELKRNNVKVEAAGDQLKVVSGKDSLTKDIILLLKNNKESLLDFLNNQGSVKTSSDFSLNELKQKDFKAFFNDNGISSSDVQDMYKLTPLQEGFLFHNLMDNESSAYFEQFSIDLSGNLDLKAFNSGWQEIGKRYDVLRTMFVTDFKFPVQVVLKNREIGFSYNDIRGEVNKDFCINNIKEEDRSKTFDLKNDSLFRVKVLHIDDDKYTVLLSFHHIILDGWCTSILFSEFLECYKGIIKNKEMPKVVPPSYSNYIKWLNKQDKNESRDYWKNYLKGYEDLASIPGYSLGHSTVPNEQTSQLFTLSKEQTTLLANLSKELGITQNTLIQTVWGIILTIYNDTEDVVFGATVSGRPKDVPRVEEMVGLFINTIPVRIQVDRKESFKDVVSRIQKEAVDSMSYHHSSLAQIQTDSGLNNNLLDHVMVFENYPIKETGFDNDSGIKIDGVEVFEQTNYDFGITVVPSDKLGFRFTYNPAIYNNESIKRIFSHIENVICDVVSNCKILITDIDPLGKDEYELLGSFNNTETSFPEDRTVIDIFEEQVKKTPNNIALFFDDIELSYKELNEKANIVGNYLRENYCIEPDNLVGVLLDRSEKMIITLLGILKSGAAYVPIDPSYPEDRIKYMLEDSSPKVVISNLDKQGINSMDIIDINRILKSDTSKENPKKISDSDNLVYVIYTSGSTGKPKGVTICNSNIINFLYSFSGKFNDKISMEDNCLSIVNISFDVSVCEIFSSLLFGAKLYIYNNSFIDIEEYCSYIERHKITTAYIHPGLLEETVKRINRDTVSLKKLLVGVEGIKDTTLNKYLDLNEDFEIINGYGPTEDTICATFYKYSSKSYTGRNVPIGSPLSNTSVYILNKDNKLSPIGVPGELCISGKGLARGYLNRPELTKEKFVNNPFSQEKKMYRTGDLARWLPDGNIKFLGRIDHQVKVRGFRIELGEIESCLFKIDGITSSIVTAKEGSSGDKYLVAYYTSDLEPETSELKTILGKTLPEYMIPSYFVRLKEVPLTPNGKVDRKALPEVDGSLDSNVDFIAPRNSIEEELVKIWIDILEVKRVSVLDNFFDLGGHSLKATTLLSRISKEFEVSIKLSDIFDCKTLESLSEVIKSASKRTFKQIEPVENQNNYEVSNAQRRLWVLNQFEESSIAYNMPGVLVLKGDFNEEAFNKAFSYVINRHESLRTRFVLENGEPRQNIVDIKLDELKLIDLIDTADKDKKVKELVINEVNRPFNLEEESLIRLTIIRIEDDKFILLFNMHHIIFDGWSMNVLSREFLKSYNSFRDGFEPDLKPLRIQYKDYSTWQNMLLESSEINEQKEYWLNKLSGEIPVLDLPSDNLRPAKQTFNGSNVNFPLSSELTKGLNRLSKDKGVSLFMILQAAVKTLLFRYTGAEDIIVGSPIAGRVHEDLEDQIGLYLNTLVLRDSINGNLEFDKFLDKVKVTCTDAFENQDYPFDKIVDDLELNRDLSRSPLFDVMVALQNNETTELSLNGLEASNYEMDIPVSKFDITYEFTEEADDIQCNIEFNTDIYNRERITRMGEHLKLLFSSIVENPKAKIKDLNILPDSDKYLLLNKFNNTKSTYPKDKTIIDLFEEQANQYPDNIALEYESLEISYRELNRKANIVANNIKANYDIYPDDLIGLKLERSESIIISILGILKAGAAYVPIDPEYPEERIEYIIKDSGVKFVIDQDNLDRIFNDSNDDTAPEKSINSNNLAYVIYTSGSTGNPKGVLLEHRSVANLIKSQIEYFKIDTFDRVLQFSNVSFDASVEQIWLALLSGASLILISKEKILSSESFNNYIKEKRITHLDTVPTYLENIDINSNKHLKRIILGGESFPVSISDDFFNKVDFYNLYGPTEATVSATRYKVTGNPKKGEVIPIGKPLSNTNVHILDNSLNLLPVGIPGELCLSGDCLARGYLNNKELTKEKFVNSTFNNGETIYRTGDLAKWLPDGNIEFLGRIDSQIKIRGFRVELGEIENSLIHHPKIDSAVVIPKEESGSTYLVAYYSSKEELDVSNIRAFLKETLPDYMIPAGYVFLKEFPLNNSGKIDKKALPEPGDNINKHRTYVAPESDLEVLLAGIWEDVLNCNEPGIDDNFLELGGDSIKAIQVTSRLSQEGYKGEVATLFNNPTIREFSLTLKKDLSKIDQSTISGVVPLSPIQKWFFNDYKSSKSHFNQSIMIKFRNKINTSKLQNSLEIIINHHDALRMVYKENDGEITQENRLESNLYYKDYDLRDLEDPSVKIIEVSNNIQSSFNLDNDTLIKFVVFKCNDFDRLLIVAHHLVVDGISWRILVEDLETVYSQQIHGKELKLPLKTTSFKSWSEELIRYSEDDKFTNEYQYWQGINSRCNESLPGANSDNLNNLKSTITLSKEYTKKLLTKSNQAFNTNVNDILLTALSRSLATWSGNYSFTIELESHGRSENFEGIDLSRTIGWFTSTYPMVLEVSNQEEIGDDIVAVKESLREVPDNGIGYGIYRYLCKSTVLTEKSDVTDVLFNYLGQFDSDREAGLLSISNEPTGDVVPKDAISSHKLNFNGIVVMEQFSMTIDSNIYTQETLDNVIKLFKNNLLEIISYTEDKVELVKSLNSNKSKESNNSRRIRI